MTNNGIFVARNFLKWHEVWFLWHEKEVETRRHEDSKARSFFKTNLLIIGCFQPFKPIEPLELFFNTKGRRHTKFFYKTNKLKTENVFQPFEPVEHIEPFEPVFQNRKHFQPLNP